MAPAPLDPPAGALASKGRSGALPPVSSSGRPCAPWPPLAGDLGGRVRRGRSSPVGGAPELQVRPAEADAASPRPRSAELPTRGPQ